MTTNEETAIKVLDKLSEVVSVGPVSAYEISTAMGLSDTSVRHTLAYLEGQGMVFKRPETLEERQLRFGRQVSLGRQACLYSISDPVPPRTTKGVFAGVVSSRSALGRGKRIEMVLKTLEEADHPLTSLEIAEACGSTVQNVSGCVLLLIRSGRIERAQKDGSRFTYRVVPKKTSRKRKIAAAAAASAAITTEIVAEDPAPSRAPAPAPTTAAPTVDLIKAIDAVVESRVAALTSDLQADNARLAAERDAAQVELDSLRAALRDSLGL